MPPSQVKQGAAAHLASLGHQPSLEMVISIRVDRGVTVELLLQFMMEKVLTALNKG